VDIERCLRAEDVGTALDAAADVARWMQDGMSGLPLPDPATMLTVIEPAAGTFGGQVTLISLAASMLVALAEEAGTDDPHEIATVFRDALFSSLSDIYDL